MLMKEAPRDAREGLMGRRDYLGILFVGGVMGAIAVALYATSGMRGDPSLGYTRALAFTFLALSPLFHAWSCRSPSHSLFSSRPFISLPLLGAVLMSAAIHLVAVLVPSLQPVFRTYDAPASDWLLVVLAAAVVVPAVEIAKIVYRLMLRRNAAATE
jgi:Ca2+-transporting ATPase